MKVIQTLVMAFGLWLCGFANAAIIVMDFTGNPVGNAPTTYTEDGMRLVSTGSASTLFNIGNPTPGYVQNTGAANTIHIDLLNGTAFQLLSFDVETQTNPFTIQIVGNRLGGGTVNESFIVNTPSNVFTTFTPTLNFSGLLNFDINVPAGSGASVFDNIRISVPDAAVPAPASFALFALGLLGMVFSRCRTKT
jgi:PEP-CTERM motif